MLDAQMDISESTIKNWEEYISTLISLKNYGTVNESAIAQAEAAKANVESSAMTLQQQIYNIENALSLLLGKETVAIERNGLDEISLPDTLSAGIPLQLLRYRPDVREAEFKLAQAFYVTNAAYSYFYPSISLSGIAGWKNDGGLTIPNPGDWIFNAVASLVQPLLNRGENVARLKVAKAQQEEALLAFRQSVLVAGAEVNDAVIALQTARNRIKKDEGQIDALKRSLQSTKLLMEHGTVNYLEVLTAAQSLLQAELVMVEDRYNEINGMISLYHAVGGGPSDRLFVRMQRAALLY